MSTTAAPASAENGFFVVTAFAINPARELLSNINEDEALRERTTIIVERKDVIYRLKADVDTFDQ